MCPFYSGPPGTQGLRSISALVWTPEEGRGEVAHSEFLPLLLGTPEKTRVTKHFCPLWGPREGRGEVASSDFVPFLLGTPENAGVAFCKQSCALSGPQEGSCAFTNYDLFPFLFGAHEKARFTLQFRLFRGA